MCKAPKPPKAPEEKPPQYLVNEYLDSRLSGAGAVDALRTGRSKLRIQLGSGTPGTGLQIAQTRS